jgi:hypothetical protein
VLVENQAGEESRLLRRSTLTSEFNSAALLYEEPSAPGTDTATEEFGRMAMPIERRLWRISGRASASCRHERVHIPDPSKFKRKNEIKRLQRLRIPFHTALAARLRHYF